MDRTFVAGFKDDTDVWLSYSRSKSFSLKDNVGADDCFKGKFGGFLLFFSDEIVRELKRRTGVITVDELDLCVFFVDDEFDL